MQRAGAPAPVLAGCLKGVGRGGHAGRHTTLADPRPVHDDMLHGGMLLGHAGGRRMEAHEHISEGLAQGVPLYEDWTNHREFAAVRRAREEATRQ